jgi:hypothetical protein
MTNVKGKDVGTSRLPECKVKEINVAGIFLSTHLCIQDHTKTLDYNRITDMA